MIRLSLTSNMHKMHFTSLLLFPFLFLLFRVSIPE